MAAPASPAITREFNQSALAARIESGWISLVGSVASLLSTAARPLHWFLNIFYWKPLFISRLENRPRRLRLDGRGMPYLFGHLKVSLGEECRVASQIALSGRTSGSVVPRLIVGNNVDIGWGEGIYVGTRVVIGHNARIAGEGTLVGYPGHPLDAAARARGAPEEDHQARDIIIGDDVWLARGVVVNAGVTIGRATVVGARSVVTKDLPGGVLAAGVPARVIKIIDEAAYADTVATRLAQECQ